MYTMLDQRRRRWADVVYMCPPPPRLTHRVDAGNTTLCTKHAINFRDEDATFSQRYNVSSLLDN